MRLKHDLNIFRWKSAQKYRSMHVQDTWSVCVALLYLTDIGGWGIVTVLSHGLRLPPPTTQERANSPPQGSYVYISYILQELLRQSACFRGGCNSLEFWSLGGLPLSWCLTVLATVQFDWLPLHGGDYVVFPRPWSLWFCEA